MARRPHAMAGMFLVVVTIAGYLFAHHPTAFLPPEDQGYCIVVAELPPGAAQPRLRELAARMASVLKQLPEIKGWITSGGYSDLDQATLSNVVTTYVMYQDWGKRPEGFSQNAFVSELRRRLQAIRSARFVVEVPPPIPGLGQGGGFQMMIEERGNGGLNHLQSGVEQVLMAAAAQPGLRGVTTTFNANSPQLYLDLNRTMAQSLGVSLNDVFQTLQTYLGSNFVNLFNKFNQSLQVRVQAGAEYRRQLSDISNLYVNNRYHQMVPLGSLLDVHRTLGSELLTRYNLYPAAPVIGQAAPGFSSGQALSLMEQAASTRLPLGMDYEWTGLAYQEKLISNQAYLIFALSIILVYLVLAAQYESWSDPAAVVLTVPMALVGVIVALLVRNFPTDLYTQIGLVLMIALAAKNAILIVEFARDLKAQGMETTAAAVEATRRRFRPILMTSIAFILSVVPLLTATGAGSASQQSLGTVVFGGMIASTLIAIPFVPVFYITMENLAQWYERRKPAVPAREAAPGKAPR